MVIWKGLTFAAAVSSAAIAAASFAPAGAGSSADIAAFVQLAQNDTPATDGTSDAPPAATETPAAGEAGADAAATEAGAAEGEAGADAAATEEGAAEGEAGADAAATEEGAAEGEEKEVAVFTEEYLNDPAHHEEGKVVWEVCAGCHGARAYPGKAPKLRPKRYTPEFVFDRVTHGYKKMPAWKDVFTTEERMAVTAYILSENFTP